MNDLNRESKTVYRLCKSTVVRSAGTASALMSMLAMAAMGCTKTYDAGSNSSHTRLPVDERNPIVLLNDSVSDNWQGEYAVLLANGGGPKLVGIVVDTSPNSPNLSDNITGWRNLVKAAQGLRIPPPDPTESIGDPLTRPASGLIKDTLANRSGGAIAIRDLANQYALPYRPLVVVTGGRLTDVADAYLIDNSLPERVVVVSSLGSLAATGGAMGPPNGEMDPWADTIVTNCFRYVQVSAYYDQLTDVPASRLSDLPANDFGKWIAAKQPNIWSIARAADQVAVAAVGIPDFAVDVERVSPIESFDGGATTGPALADDLGGSGWLVRQSDGAAATKRFWTLLGDPATFAP